MFQITYFFLTISFVPFSFSCTSAEGFSSILFSKLFLLKASDAVLESLFEKDSTCNEVGRGDGYFSFNNLLLSYVFILSSNATISVKLI